MALPLLFQAITTAGFVAGLLLLLRRAGPRWQGVAASLPVSSVPALFWLGLEQGAEFAASAAGAALLAAALTPLAAAVYGRLCARVGPLPCLLAALAVGAVALLLLMPWLGQRPLLALALALGMGALALHLLPHTAPAPARQRHWCSEVLLTAGVAGMLTLLVSALALVVGPGACGALEVGKFLDHGELGAGMTNGARGLCRDGVAGQDDPADEVQKAVGAACHIRPGVRFPVRPRYGFR